MKLVYLKIIAYMSMNSVWYYLHFIMAIKGIIPPVNILLIVLPKLP